MSVKFKKTENSNWGRFVVTTDADCLSAEDYVDRVGSLIRVLQGQDKDFQNQEDNYAVLEILNDMMPTPEQAEQMFKSPH